MAEVATIAAIELISSRFPIKRPSEKPPRMKTYAVGPTWGEIVGKRVYLTTSGKRRRFMKIIYAPPGNPDAPFSNCRPAARSPAQRQWGWLDWNYRKLL